jgi:hypothetical protein
MLTRKPLSVTLYVHRLPCVTQVHFEHVTRASLQIKALRQVSVTMAVLVPLFTAVCIAVDWSVMSEFEVSETYCYVYTCTLLHWHIAVWFVMCCIVATTTRHLLGMLRQVTNIILSQLHIKGKAIPLQALRGPEGSRRLRLPDFKTIGTWRW